jgi:ATP-dependent Clp protease ATP-binding subunit ClpA
VGYGTGGVLTEAVRRRPYSVVLLDEVEKAHPDVLELFYQVFDKGNMEDGEGVPVDFKNTVILLTSNVGSDEIIRACHPAGGRPSAESLAALIRPELVARFKPALLGRMVIVPYLPLRDVEIREIVKLKLNKIERRVREQHLAALTYTPQVVELITQRCTEVDTGARNVDHIVTHSMLPELSARVLDWWRAVTGSAARICRSICRAISSTTCSPPTRSSASSATCGNSSASRRTRRPDWHNRRNWHDDRLHTDEHVFQPLDAARRRQFVAARLSR